MEFRRHADKSSVEVYDPIEAAASPEVVTETGNPTDRTPIETRPWATFPTRR